MHHLGRAIPSHPQIGFHIAVIGEQFAMFVERKIISIADSACEQFNIVTIQIHTQDNTTGCFDAVGMTTGVLVFWLDQVALVKLIDWARRGVVACVPGVIANRAIDFAIRAESQSMGTMFSETTSERQDAFSVLKSAISVLILEKVNPETLLALPGNKNVAVQWQNSLTTADQITTNPRIPRLAGVVK